MRISILNGDRNWTNAKNHFCYKKYRTNLRFFESIIYLFTEWSSWQNNNWKNA